MTTARTSRSNAYIEGQLHFHLDVAKNDEGGYNAAARNTDVNAYAPTEAEAIRLCRDTLFKRAMQGDL